MVSVITGAGLGLERGSGLVLGSRGQLGSSVTVNAANGNLILQNQDEILIGLGPDVILTRSYNSLGQMMLRPMQKDGQLRRIGWSRYSLPRKD